MVDAAVAPVAKTTKLFVVTAPEYQRREAHIIAACSEWSAANHTWHLHLQSRQGVRHIGAREEKKKKEKRGRAHHHIMHQQPHYPEVVDRSMVGHYHPECKSGGGMRYDRVLEYRLWYRTGNGELTLQVSHDPTQLHRLAMQLSSSQKKEQQQNEMHLLVLVEQDWHWAEDREQGNFYNLLDRKWYRREMNGPRQTEWQMQGLFCPAPTPRNMIRRNRPPVVTQTATLSATLSATTTVPTQGAPPAATEAAAEVDDTIPGAAAAAATSVSLPLDAHAT